MTSITTVCRVVSINCKTVRHTARAGANVMTFAIYSRKSVATGRGDSVENQVEMCRRYMYARFDGVTEDNITVYEDEGYSGRHMDRPRFQAMLSDIRHQRIQGVVCYRLDRMSRNVSEFSALIEELNSRGVALICIREEFDTAKPMGKAMMYMASVFAQLERETIAERVRDNMRMLARSGRWLGGATPFGFTAARAAEDKTGKFSCRLQPEPAELEAVKKMYGQFLRVRTVAGVDKYLCSEGIVSRGGKPFSRPGIRLILQNPVYCAADEDAHVYFTKQQAEVCFTVDATDKSRGLLAYNKRDYHQKNAPRQAVSAWIVAAGRHEAAVSGRDWVAAQYILQGKQTKAPPRNAYALLSGWIACEVCGTRMRAKRRQNNPACFDYLCEMKRRGGVAGCAGRNINGNRADDAVCEALLTGLPWPALPLEERRALLAARIAWIAQAGKGLLLHLTDETAIALSETALSLR